MNSAYSRRRFIANSATFLALPYLASLFPIHAKAATGPKRLMFMQFPCGVYDGAWVPTGSGTNFQLPENLESLANLKNYLTFPLGLDHALADEHFFDSAGAHARAAGSYLTGSELSRYTSDLEAGISIDRLIANKLGINSTPRCLSIMNSNGNEYNDGGWSAAYMRSLSWNKADAPVSPFESTLEVFNRLFPNSQPAPVEMVDKKKRRKKSILDALTGEIASLRLNLNPEDARTLEKYTESVREIERGIVTDVIENPMACAPTANPGEVNGSDFARFTKTMLDLVAKGFECDRTQIVAYQMDSEGSDRSGIAGVNAAHHNDCSHHGNSQAKIDNYLRITEWYAQQYAYFLEKLKNTPTGDGQNLLDASIVVLGTGLSDGRAHSGYNVPVIVAGKGGGTINSGRMIARASGYGDEKHDYCPLSNLWVAIAEKMGAPVDSFGDSKGKVSL